MKLAFVKMQGAGNDFVVIDAVRQSFEPTARLMAHIGDRKKGIGADQILVVQKTTKAGCDFRYRIFNADGSEAQMCGNGARAFAIFLRDQKLTDKTDFFVETLAGNIRLMIGDNNVVTVGMPAPVLLPSQVPYDGQWPRREALNEPVCLYPVNVGEQDWWVHPVGLGNPHAICFVDDLEKTPVASVGPAIEHSPLFPARTNVSFVQCLSRTSAKMCEWERGAGQTLACGTGATATVVSGILRGLFDKTVSVQMAGGTLTVSWDGLRNREADIYLSGPVQTVFSGTIELPNE